jgi:uncharacterized protein (UPF0210 family)
MECAFLDKRQGETVNLVNEEQVRKRLEDKFGPVDLNLVPVLEKGEVLLDSRGRGSFQKM